MTTRDVVQEAGLLDKRVTIEAPPLDGLPNALGEVPALLPWDFVCEVWASITTTSGKEVYREAQVQPDATHLVKIRYRNDVQVGQRVSYQGRQFNSYRVDDPGELHAMLYIWCQEQR